jgi:hypothetical protein
MALRQPFHNSSAQTFWAIRISKNAVFHPLAQCSDDGFWSAEVHIGYPHWQQFFTTIHPFDAFSHPTVG